MTTPEPRKYTDAQIMAAISAAIRAEDFEAVSGLMKLLALQNPTEADILRRSIIALAGARP